MIQIKNTQQSYGLVSIVLHWLSAITIIGLFALGLWMDDLDYYHTWYKKAPDLHRSIGVLLVLVFVFRLVWRVSQTRPAPMASHKPWEVSLAHVVHWIFYGFLLLMFCSGYLITTAKGQPLYIFDWFSIPASITDIDNLEDWAGEVHELLAFTLIGLAVLHGAAALKHHFIDRDGTLLRMLGRRDNADSSEV